MRVSGLDENNDWRFGRGKALYLTRSEAIRQNVVTRLKSFKTDFFLDTDANIDWIDLLGRKGTKDEILRNVERVTLATDGVTIITSLDIQLKTSTRNATIMLSFGTIFDESITEEIII
jgi:Tfp pilus assembly protein FimT